MIQNRARNGLGTGPGTVITDTRTGPSVAARGRPLNSKLWGRVAAPGWAASRLPLSAESAGNAGCSLVLSARWALWRLGTSSEGLPCAGGGCAAVLGGSVPRGGARSGPIAITSPTCAATQSKYPAQCPSRVHRVTSDKTEYCNVQDHVPAPPRHLINLI